MQISGFLGESAPSLATAGFGETEKAPQIKGRLFREPLGLPKPERRCQARSGNLVQLK